MQVILYPGSRFVSTDEIAPFYKVYVQKAINIWIEKLKLYCTNII